MIRAGRDGEREEEALTHGLAIGGWPEMGDLGEFNCRNDLHAAVRTTYPGISRTAVTNWTGQLWRLRQLIQVDDLVVLPLKTVPDHVAIGRIDGGYTYRASADPDRRHVRSVHWLRREIPKAVIGQDLLYSMGSLLTICQLSRNGAARRLAVIADTGNDPGPKPGELDNGELRVGHELLS